MRNARNFQPFNALTKNLWQEAGNGISLHQNGKSRLDVANRKDLNIRYRYWFSNDKSRRKKTFDNLFLKWQQCCLDCGKSDHICGSKNCERPYFITVRLHKPRQKTRKKTQEGLTVVRFSVFGLGHERQLNLIFHRGAASAPVHFQLDLNLIIEVELCKNIKEETFD